MNLILTKMNRPLMKRKGERKENGKKCEIKQKVPSLFLFLFFVLSFSTPSASQPLVQNNFCTLQNKTLSCDGTNIRSFLTLEKALRNLEKNSQTVGTIDLIQISNLMLLNSTFHLEIFAIFENLKFIEFHNCTLKYVKDVSNHPFSSFPLNSLKGLKSLKILGSNITCKWVMEELWELWTEKEGEKSNFLNFQDDIFCEMDGTTTENSYTFLGVLKAKTALKEKCGKVDDIGCECKLEALRYNENIPKGHEPVHNGKHGNVSISLEVNCTGRNLTNLPDLPSPTVRLYVSHNSIKDISPLGKREDYKDLQIFDASYNEIANLEPLDDSPFLSRMNYLGLDHNEIEKFPSRILNAIHRTVGSGVTSLGYNYILCDCYSIRDILPIFRRDIKKFFDHEKIYCSNFKDKYGHQVALARLSYSVACIQEIEDTEFWWYITIGVEVFFILLILGKTWLDKRNYRETGALPWFSAKMPRLPCDFILERLKKDTPCLPKQIPPEKRERINFIHKYVRTNDK